jgi:hypothetical protein
MIRTGETKRFNTLEDYERYKASLEAQGTFCPEVEAKYTQGYTPGKNTTHSGFLEFAPRDPVAQAKYSAMSSGWEGAASSETAIARGDYDLDMAEKNRSDLRASKAQPVLQMPNVVPESAWNCSIQ